MKESQTRKFCSCIKKVHKTLKSPKPKTESRAIAICVKSVLQTRGKTIHSFRCRGEKPYVRTQVKKGVKKVTRKNW